MDVHCVFTMAVTLNDKGVIIKAMPQYHGRVTAPDFKSAARLKLEHYARYDPDNNVFAGWPIFPSELLIKEFVKHYNNLKGNHYD